MLKYYAGGKITGLSTEAKPPYPELGWVFYTTDTNQIFIYDGTGWRDTGIM